MRNIYIDIQFKGIGFSPNKLREITGLPVKTLVECGEIAKIGRYKGTASPFGIGLLRLNPDDKDVLNDYSDLLYNKKNILKEIHATEIIFDIETSVDVFSDFIITPELSKKLSSINARIEFHNIHKKETEVGNLIEQILSNLSTHSISKRRKIKTLLKKIEENSEISIKNTAELVLYLLDNINKKREFKQKAVSTVIKD